ncbi:MAG: hypothetical protein ACRDT7_00710 [Microbacterium sp.]
MTGSIVRELQFWETRYRERFDGAMRTAHAVSNDVLLGSSVQDIVQAIIDEFAADEIAARWDDFDLELSESRATRGPNGPALTEVNPLLISLNLPLTGASEELRGPTNSGRGGGGQDVYVRSYQGTLAMSSDTDPDEVRRGLEQWRTEWFEKMALAIEEANLKIREHRVALHEAVYGLVSERHKRLHLLDSAARSLDIPLNKSSAPVGVPLRPRSLTLVDIEKSARAGGSEAGLRTDIADALVDQISAFAAALERLPETANRLAPHDEETLRDILLFILNANWQGQVTGETFVGQGKTDIHMSWRGREAFIGECKFWHGEKHFSDALDQLLDRYTVWRATRVAVVVFIRDIKDVTAVLEKAKATIQKHHRFVAVADSVGEAFLMHAQSDNQQLIRLAFIPVVMPASRTLAEARVPA